MIRRARLLLLMARPAVVVLLGLFGALGLAQAGRPGDLVLLAEVLVVVLGFLLFAVCVNDLADEAVDRVNLPGDRRRPLVAGTGTRRQLWVLGVAGAVAALGASSLLHWPAPLVVAGGLVLAAAYSLPPARLAARGAVASLVLPAGYVAVPFLSGVLAVRATVSRDDLALMAGLYVGFIGRIVLKDFRDARGDALFGKRTFLVRHGRRATCVLSLVGTVVGALAVLGTQGFDAPLTACLAALVAATALLLWPLAGGPGHRRDEALISAVAICGRGGLLVLLAYLTVTSAAWSAPSSALLLGALTTIVLGQARTMARHGPPLRTVAGAPGAGQPV